jgi:DNA replicative helicase MCM subunit Mcm2 (Cdc46/Mcm family)
MDQIDSGASHDNMEPIMDGLVAEFMSNAENQRRIRNIVGRGNRLNVSIDEVRHFNPKLANYVKNKPI